LAGIPIPAQLLWTPRGPGPRGWEALSAASIQQKEGARHKAPPLGAHRGFSAQSPALHSAQVPDEDGIRLLFDPRRNRLGRLSHLWVDGGYQGRGRRWAEEGLGLSGEVVHKPKKPLPENVALSAGLRSGPRRAKKGELAEVDACEKFCGCCRGGGWWRAPWRGLATTGGWPKTTRGYVPPGRLSSTKAMSRLMVRRLARA
jgi:hypothetical protein